MKDYLKALQRLEAIQHFEEVDYNKPVDINVLINAEGYFTQLHSYYSEKTAVDYRECQIAEKRRKRAYNEALIAYKEQKNTDLVSKAKAESDVSDELDLEIEANSNHMLSKMRRESIGKMLDFLRQKISYEKQELQTQQFIKGE